MKKILVCLSFFVVLIAISISSASMFIIHRADASGMMLAITAGQQAAGGADTTSPELNTPLSHVIGADGDALSISWIEASGSVSRGAGYLDSQIWLVCTTAGNVGFTYSSGDGTTTWSGSLDTIVPTGDSCILHFDGESNSVVDPSDNGAPDAYTLTAITNNSTVPNFGYEAVLDDFNRTDEGPPPSSSWTNLYGTLQVVSNQCKASTTEFSLATWNTSYGSGAESYVTIVTRPTAGKSVSVYISLDLDNVNGYVANYIYNAGTDTVKLIRLDEGVETQVGSTINQDFNDGDGLGIEHIGNTIKIYRRASGVWTQIGGDFTDTTYTASGYMGLAVEDSTTVLDNFGGGTR